MSLAIRDINSEIKVQSSCKWLNEGFFGQCLSHRFPIIFRSRSLTVVRHANENPNSYASNDCSPLRKEGHRAGLSNTPCADEITYQTFQKLQKKILAT